MPKNDNASVVVVLHSTVITHALTQSLALFYRSAVGEESCLQVSQELYCYMLPRAFILPLATGPGGRLVLLLFIVENIVAQGISKLLMSIFISHTYFCSRYYYVAV